MTKPILIALGSIMALAVGIAFYVLFGMIYGVFAGLAKL